MVSDIPNHLATINNKQTVNLSLCLYVCTRMDCHLGDSLACVRKSAQGPPPAAVAAAQSSQAQKVGQTEKPQRKQLSPAL